MATPNVHFHIHWSSQRQLDHERFETAEKAESAARDIVRPDETYTIEQCDETCPCCADLKSRGKSESA